MRRYLLTVLAAILLAFATPAQAAERVARNKDNGNELRLYESVCSHGETLAQLREEWRDKFKNLRILDEKGFISWYGCWYQEDADTVVIVLQDGSMAAMENSVFADPSI